MDEDLSNKGNAPKKTRRKSVARDVVEPAEEKAVTPSRRSTRIRSNTSLVLETAQVVDSPRAKRAARRISQLGSDTETTTTPARQTRRTRKDSTSSVDKLAVTNPNEKVTGHVVEVITEEPEKEIVKDFNDDNKEESSTPKRSPRLMKKGKKRVDEAGKDNNKNREQKDRKLSNTINFTEETLKTDITPKNTVVSLNDNEKGDSILVTKSSEKENLSITSINLINELGTNPKNFNIFNKTTSDIEESNSEKKPRNRTKSWTTITDNLPSGDGNFVGKINNKVKTDNLSSGDNILKIGVQLDTKSLNKSDVVNNTLVENKKNLPNLRSNDKLDAIETIKLLEKTPSKEIQSIVLLEDSNSNTDSVDKLIIDIHHEDEDQCVPVVQQSISQRSPKKNESFACEPMDIDETIPENVTLNDFNDTNTSEKVMGDKATYSKRKSSISKENTIDINNSSNKSKRTSSISRQDESNTISLKSSINVSEVQKILSSAQAQEDNSEDSLVNKSNKQSPFTSQAEDYNIINESANKSKIKNSISESSSQNVEKADNKNKSTLVLSQLKDVSENDIDTELSKSVNTPNVIKDKESDKKTPSLNYLTSTPLQQKPLQKIGMHINTSIVTPNAETNNTNKKMNKKTTPKKNVSVVSSQSSDTSNNESEEASRESKILDDEAEEASDNYESGDSRESAEKEYEKENEIVEEGETLETEEEFSDDSDYEKDSFIVSSDGDDDELLSGSSDDLSLSDKELKMTTKSKKKFDERKRKQQKKASREMYEARHKLNDSDKSLKGKNQETKKPKRQRLESSMLESEKEETQTKRKGRLRIHSSQDSSLNKSDDDEPIRRKKKVKRLSESVCEENVTLNEKEITICNQSVTDKKDPLLAAVKQEPKTPQKNLDISTVTLTNNIEEIQLDSNVSIMKPNETSDPLQVTVAQGEQSDSDSSDHVEIVQNYDFVLHNLSKENNKLKKTKTLELPLNKKTKAKSNDPLVDLNLTHVKTFNKNKVQVVNDKKKDNEAEGNLAIASKNSEVSVGSMDIDEGETSDSIDMRLLFPEDSNDSEVNSSKSKPADKTNMKPAQDFIPLKRTEAKTNLRESVDEPDSANLSFFIDTAGAREDMDTSAQNTHLDLSISNAQDNAVIDLNASLQNSAKKNKKNKHPDLSIANTQNVIDTDLISSNQNSAKKNKKNKDLNQSTTNIQNDAEIILNASQNSAKKNKKKKHLDESTTSAHNDSEVVLNTSSQSSAKKNKKKKHLDESTSIVQGRLKNESLDASLKNDKKNNKNEIDVSISAEKIIEVKYMTASEKKKSKKTSNSTENNNETLHQNTDNVDTEEASINITMKGDKEKRHKHNVSIDYNEPTMTMGSHSKKKKSKKLSDTSIDHNQTQSEHTESQEAITDNIPRSDKKYKKDKKKSLEVSQIMVDNTGNDSEEAPMEVSYKSEKNNKSDNADPTTDDNVLNTDSGKKKKKNKKMKDIVQPEINQTGEIEVNTGENDATSNNRKRKLSEELSSPNHEKKRRNISHNPEDAPTEEPISHTVEEYPVKEVHQKKFKKNKKSKNRQNKLNTEPEGATQNKSNKRKDREHDISQNKSKVFKENSFDKIHIPRLPESVVNQLNDKPSKQITKQKTAKAIATTQFIVETDKKRKNKPSKYLEESIYINDSPVKTKPKASIKNPKVLPFTPTVLTSDKGYTSNFKINVLAKETQFVAQTSDVSNFKNEYLAERRIKKLGTFERFKKHRNHKLSKF